METKTTLFDYTKAELAAGLFIVVGLAILGYLSTSIAGLRLLPRDAYHLVGRFSNVGDLKVHAPVKIAGVTVGRVESIRLADYVAEANLAINRPIRLPKDTIASIATAGLLGDAYVSLSPGGADADLREGDRIAQTEPALNMADLVGRAAFGASPAAPAPAAGDAGPLDEPTPQKKGSR